jgi:hypothetical protein
MKRLGLIVLWVAGCTQVVWLGKSDDRHHSIEVVERLGRQAVRVDGVEGPSTRGVSLDSLAVDGEGRASYAAMVDEGWAFFAQGAHGPGWQHLGVIARSDDGGVAFTALSDGGWFVVMAGRPVSTPTPSQLAHRAGQWVWVADAQEVMVEGRGLGRSGRVSMLTTMDQTLRWVVTEQNVQFIVSSEGRREGPFRQVRQVEPVVAQALDGGWQLRVNGAEVATQARPFRAVRGADGALVSIIEHDGGQLVRTETSSESFDEVKDVVWLTSPVRPVVVGRRGAQWTVFGPFGESGPWDVVENLRTQGHHVAFIGVRAMSDTVVHDGTPLATVPRATSLALSDDGTQVAYLTSRGGEVQFALHRDGGLLAQTVDLALEDTVTFAPNGRAGCIAGARPSRTLFVLFDDGARIPVSLEEVVAAQARWSGPQAPRLRRWVVAELMKTGGTDAGRP